MLANNCLRNLATPTSYRWPVDYLLLLQKMRWAKVHLCTTPDMAGHSLLARPSGGPCDTHSFKRTLPRCPHLVAFVAFCERVPDSILERLAVGGRDVGGQVDNTTRRGSK